MKTKSGYLGVVPEGFALGALLPQEVIDELKRTSIRPTEFIPVGELPDQHSEAWLAGQASDPELLMGVFRDEEST